jgi:thiol-disulfide isomerase/thioredoxin
MGLLVTSCGKEAAQNLGEEWTAVTDRPLAPDFTLKDMDGKSVQLVDSRGRVVIVDFWATWCPPCQAEIPHFIELYDDYANQGLEILGISLDRSGEQVVRPFVQEFAINYSVLVEGEQSPVQVAQEFGGVVGIPTTFLIDRQGRIYKKFVGYVEKSILEREVRVLLAEEA